MFSCCISSLPLWAGLAYFIYYIFDALWSFVQSKRVGEDNEAKVVLITGCDSGFGYHTALKLSSSKCNVLAGCLTKEGVHRLERDEKFNGKAFVIDVTKEDDIKDAAKLVEKETESKGTVLFGMKFLYLFSKRLIVIHIDIYQQTLSTKKQSR